MKHDADARSFFAAHGTALTLDAGTPVSLAEEGAVWFVAKGRLDVFLVKGEGDPRTLERSRCCSVENGHAVFGHGVAEGASLLAVGIPGTVAYKADVAALGAMDGEVLAKLLDDSLGLLAEALAADVGASPEAERQLGAQGTEEVPALTVLRSGHRLAWVRHVSGMSLYMGMEDLPDSGLWFPLAPAAWMQTLTDSVVNVESSSGLVRDEGLWRGVSGYLRTFLACTSLNAAFASADRLVSLREKAAADVRVARGGLLRLASVIDSGIAPPSAHDSADTLAAACGLVARAIGVNVAALERPLSGRTVNDVAESGHMRARRVLLRDDWFRTDGGPLLAFTADGGRPVALLPVSPSSYVLHDPKDGSARPVDRSVAEALAPEAYTLYRPLPPRKLGLSDIPPFGLRGSWRDLAWAGGLSAVGGLVGLVVPMLTRTIYNDIIPGAERGRLLQVVAIIFGFTVASLFFELAKSIFVQRTRARTDHNLEPALWDRLLRLPATFFRQFTAGDLAQRTMALVRVQDMLSSATFISLFSAVFSLLYLALLFFYDTKLALLSLALVLVSALATTVVSAVQIRLQRKVVGLQGKLSGLTLQFISGVAKLRAGGAEDRALALWAEDFAQQGRVGYTMASVGNAFDAFNALFGVLGSALIFAGAVYFERDNDMDMGTFMAFWAAFGGLQGGLLTLVGGVTKVFQAKPLFERLEPILSELPEDGGSDGDPGRIEGAIEVSGVTFGYGENGPMVLRDVSFKVEPGSFVAITGPSGSGKSTLLRLLLGFEKPQSGCILYENQDLSQLDAAKVRKQLGVVLQNGGLLPGDIFTNIIGASTLTIEDAWQAARMAGLDEDIKEMPMGMHTVISEGAGTLSGGQRQRLIIARALARKPRVLLLDEATSALDNRTQDIVTQSLNRLPVTRIVIAHRLSTIKDADRIIVMDRGEVKEQGTFEELMNAGGLFSELAKRQMA